MIVNKGATGLQPAGTIAGNGIFATGGSSTIINGGAIAGVSFNPGFTDRLVVDPGAVFSASVNGGNTIGAGFVTTLELAPGPSSGILSGNLGTQFVNFGSIVFDAGADWFIAGNTSGLAGTINGFDQGDTIEITGITVTGSSYSGGVLTLTDNGPVVATLNLPGAFTTTSFLVTNVAGGAEVSVACFRAGTNIRTIRGDVPVEQLLVDDQIEALLCAKTVTITWIGHRTLDSKRHPNPTQVWPVRVAAGAFGPDRPQRVCSCRRTTRCSLRMC